MRLAVPIVALALAAAALAGCGGSSSDQGATSEGSSRGPAQAPRTESGPVGASARSCEARAADAAGLRATGVSCDRARQVMYDWQRHGSCSSPPGASRSACTTHSYRCLAARTDRGIAVSCSRQRRSIAFVAKRD